MPLDQVELDENYEIKGNKEMSFFEHIDELRKHLFRGVVVLVVLTIAAFTQPNLLFDKILYAPRHADFITYRAFCQIGKWFGIDSLCVAPPQFTTFTTSLGEGFFTHLKVSFIAALIVGMPYLLWELWRFVRPGLFDNEIKSVRGIVGVCSGLFFFGVFFGYFMVAPMAISFLAGYQIPGTSTTTTLASYLSYMMMFTLPIGLIFEMPVIIYFLAKLGIVNAEFLRKYRRHTAVFIVVAAGIITPSPDVVSQMLVAVPLYLLYEVSIRVTLRVEQRRLAEYKKSLQK